MNTLSKIWRTATAALAFVVLSLGAAHAGDDKLNALGGIAMDGFDVISYFDSSKPAKGSSEFTYEYRGATWTFASAENRDKFAADPAKYEPKYNGWCANAVSKGYAADVDFVNGWAVIDGGLYLFWADSTKHNFLSDITAKRVRAEDNWPTACPVFMTAPPASRATPITSTRSASPTRRNCPSSKTGAAPRYQGRTHHAPAFFHVSGGVRLPV